MIKNINQEGFASILEVIVASIIFMTTAVGFFSAMTMLRPQGANSTKKLQALYVGKQVADKLRAQVYGNLWIGGALDPAGGTRSQTIGAYTVNYTVTDVNPYLRRLDMTVEYPN